MGSEAKEMGNAPQSSWIHKFVVASGASSWHTAINLKFDMALC